MTFANRNRGGSGVYARSLLSSLQERKDVEARAIAGPARSNPLATLGWLAGGARRAIDVAQSPRVPIRAARRSRTGANKARPTSERVWWLNKSRLRGR